MQRFLHLLRDDWPRLLLEIGVLVLGITGSFALDQWRREREDRETERRYLAAIRDNLVADSVALTRMMARAAQLEHAHRSLLSNPRPDSLDVWMDQTISYASFVRTDVAYQELVQGGDTRLLRDVVLLQRLIQLYRRPYDRVAEWDRINREYVLNRLVPYMDREGPAVEFNSDSGIVSGLGGMFPTLRQKGEYRNLLRSGMTYREAQRTVYGLALAEVRPLLAAVDSTLAR